ncbi:hypothetical protein ACIQWN_37490 [Streptomyces vinaceus]|uniref:hypothetical protein n=1 Tax=Streptomyces vinaceus TaxID=1960 RepID=UPI003803182B
MRPPRAGTWGRLGRTPVVRVRGRGSGRVPMTELSCHKSAQRSRMSYRFHVHRGRKDEKKGLTCQDYQDLPIRAHIRLGGPTLIARDNLRAHLMTPIQESIEAAENWPTVFQLPSHTPDLNPQEDIWCRWSSTPSATRRRQPRPAGPSRQTQPEADPVPTPPHRQVPRLHRPDHGRLTTHGPTSRIQIQYFDDED